MATRINLKQLQRPNEAVRTAVGTYFSELPAFMRADNDNGVIDEARADANETAMLAGALTQTALEAIEADYPPEAGAVGLRRRRGLTSSGLPFVE